MANLPHNQEELDAFESSWNNPVHLLESACNQQSGDIIRQVRENASMEYKLTKRKKQQELSIRVDDAKRISKTEAKNVKKKVDNHASSVASRSRRIYLISSYETLVRSKMQETSRLAEIVLRQKADEAKKDAEIRRMRILIHELTKELDTIKAKLPTTQSTVHSSCNSLPQENTWQDFSTDSIHYESATPTAPTPRYVQSDAGPFNPPLDRTDLQDDSYEDAEEQPSDFTSYLERETAPAPAEGLQGVEDCLKMESADWGSVPTINFKGAQAQMKADTPDNVLQPAV